MLLFDSFNIEFWGVTLRGRLHKFGGSIVASNVLS